MSDTHFKVVTDVVRDVAGRIDDVSVRFEQVAQRRVGYSGYADAPAVDDGLGEFFGKWTDGMQKIHTHLDHLAQRLHHAVDAYEGTEDSIIQSEQT